VFIYFLWVCSRYCPKKDPTQSKGGTLGRASILLQKIVDFARKFAFLQPLAKLVVVGVVVHETGASVGKNEMLSPWVLST